MTSPITTHIHVHNTIEQQTANKVLMFLQPVEVSANYQFSAWNVLNPGRGSSQHVDLTTSFSASNSEWGSSRGDYTDPVALPLGTAVTINDLGGQSATINTGEVHGPLTPAQVGMYNAATTPPTDLSVTWYVNGNKVVETNNTDLTTLNPGFTSTFELKQSVYVMFGQAPTVTQTYLVQTFSNTVEIAIPNGATDVYIVAYTGPDGDTFKSVDAPTFQALQRGAAEAREYWQLAYVDQPADDGLQTERKHIQNVRLAPAGGGVNPLAGFVGQGEVTVDNGTVIRLAARTFTANLPVVGTRYHITFDYMDGTPGARTLQCRTSEPLSIFS